MALNEFVFASDEEIFIYAMGSLLPSPGPTWSTWVCYADGAQSQPTGDRALIWRIQAVPMRVMFEQSNDPKVGVYTLLLDAIHRVVHCMKDGMHDHVTAKQA